MKTLAEPGCALWRPPRFDASSGIARACRVGRRQRRLEGAPVAVEASLEADLKLDSRGPGGCDGVRAGARVERRAAFRRTHACPRRPRPHQLGSAAALGVATTTPSTAGSDSGSSSERDHGDAQLRADVASEVLDLVDDAHQLGGSDAVGEIRSVHASNAAEPHHGDPRPLSGSHRSARGCASRARRVAERVLAVTGQVGLAGEDLPHPGACAGRRTRRCARPFARCPARRGRSGRRPVGAVAPLELEQLERDAVRAGQVRLAEASQAGRGRRRPRCPRVLRLRAPRSALRAARTRARRCTRRPRAVEVRER